MSSQPRICVVEVPADVERIERTGRFRGRYHVLHGALDPLHGVYAEDLRIPRLLDRVAAGPNVEEVLLATTPTVEGEATAMYLERLLHGLYPQVRVTRLRPGPGGDAGVTAPVPTRPIAPADHAKASVERATDDQ